MEKELPSYLREGRLAMCVISRQGIIVTRRVTVSRDGIESATRKSEIKSIAVDFPKSTEVNSWTGGHTLGSSRLGLDSPICNT